MLFKNDLLKWLILVGTLLLAPLTQAANYNLSPLGTPRILLSDPETLPRLQALMQTNANSALRFKEMVDNQIAGVDDYWGFQNWNAALLAKVLSKPSYCQYAVKKTDAFVVSEEKLISQKQRPTVSYDSYLEVGAIIGNAAIIYDWCRGSMTNTQRQRWRTYSNQAVWNVWHPNQAKWGTTLHPWSGWSIDNPSNNYYYSFLEATMLLGLATYGENSQAQTWLDQFRMTKLENQLFPTFNQELQGGGSREGTGYGVSMQDLWRLYDWWGRSTGERIADKTPHTKSSIAAMLFQINPSLNRLNPTGDHARDSSAMLFDYHRNYLQILMQLYRNERISGVAKTLLAKSSVTEMQSPFMFVYDYLYDSSNIAAQPLTILNTAYRSSGTGQFSARSSWTSVAATHLNFICGPYTEAHAHRDQGSFTLFQRNWLAYDANIDSHSGINQDEVFHNLVRFEKNGTVINQGMSLTGEAGQCELQRLAKKSLYTYAAARITPVYSQHPEILKSEREIIFISPQIFIVFDRANSTATTKKIWTLNLPKKPTIAGNKTTLLQTTNGVSHQLDITRLSPSVATTTLKNWKTINSDLLNGYRLDVTDPSTTSSYFLHLFDINKAVKQTNLFKNSTQTGAILELNNGQELTVKFNNSTVGGRISIKDTNSILLIDESLPNIMQSLVLYK